MERPLRIALASYRAHPEVGGQGVYVSNLSSALRDLGHEVTVLAGQPYPVLPEGVHLEALPGLDLYRPEDPFRTPALREFRGATDVLEYGLMCTGAFPEPLTFSLRLADRLRDRDGDFDVIHDNQCLGYGMLRIASRMPLLTTIHHPISIDRRMALNAAGSRARRISQRRWYSFVSMQKRVAGRLPAIVTVSETARQDIVRDFAVPPERISVVHNGVDQDLFRPLGDTFKAPGRLVTVASSDQASKGMEFLLEALAKIRTERSDVTLTVVGRGGETKGFKKLVNRFDLSDAVETTGRIETLDLVERLNRTEIAVVPSLYEGFSLPAVEAMACGLPVIGTTAGAFEEIVGEAGVTVPPADAGALASAIISLLDDPEQRALRGEQGRRRVIDRYTWRTTAEQMVDRYRAVMSRC